MSGLGLIIADSMLWYIFVPFFIFLFLNLIKDYIGLYLRSSEIFKFSFYGVFFSFLTNLGCSIFLDGLVYSLVSLLILLIILSYLFVANGGIDNFFKIFGILIPVVLISEFLYFCMKSIIVAAYFYFSVENAGFFETFFMQFRLALIFLGILDFDSLEE